MKTSEIIKTALVFEGIINLERRMGILLPLEELINFIKDDSKRYNEKLSVKEIKEILDVLLTAGILIYPKKGFIERVSEYKEFQAQQIKEARLLLEKYDSK